MICDVQQQPKDNRQQAIATRIGFVQGRLSPLVDGNIQAFPRDYWRHEFALAEQLGFDLMRPKTSIAVPSSSCVLRPRAT